MKTNAVRCCNAHRVVIVSGAVSGRRRQAGVLRRENEDKLTQNCHMGVLLFALISFLTLHRRTS